MMVPYWVATHSHVEMINNYEGTKVRNHNPPIPYWVVLPEGETIRHDEVLATYNWHEHVVPTRAKAQKLADRINSNAL